MGTKRGKKSDFIKAINRGSREGTREIYGDGFKSITKVHKSSKNYDRKDGKYKLNPNNIPDDVD
jgi:hypothetical protein